MILGLAQKAQQAKFLLNENSPTILSSIAVVGTVATAALTGRATFRAADMIAEEERKMAAKKAEEVAKQWATSDEKLTEDDVKAPFDEKLTRTRKAKLVWKAYIPPATTCAVTITCIVMAHRITSSKIAALTVASAISERSLQEYKRKVFDRIGEREEQKVRDDIAQERVTKHPPNNREVIIAGAGEVLCLDLHSGRYFQSTVEEIKRAENKVNHELLNFMHVSLSEFYDELGLPPTSYSDHVGWNANDRVEVKISATMTPDQRPCMAVDFAHHPYSNYHSKFLAD